MIGIADVHCHLLPGVDDGAESMEETLRLLQMEYQQGVRRLVLTPHYRAEYFETSREKIKQVFQQVQERIERLGITDMQLFLGCEFHRCSGMKNMLKKEPAYRMAGSDYVLLEFSGSDSMDVIRRYTTELLSGGYRPIIAHAERYPALRELRQIHFLVDSGAYIQVNAASLIGQEGWRSKRFCRKLLEEQCIHLIGSDAHDCRRRPPMLDRCASYLVKKTGPAQAEQLLIVNPSKIFTNEYI